MRRISPVDDEAVAPSFCGLEDGEAYLIRFHADLPLVRLLPVRFEDIFRFYHSFVCERIPWLIVGNVSMTIAKVKACPQIAFLHFPRAPQVSCVIPGYGLCADSSPQDYVPS